ncbi:MAG: NUDIX hydrolase [Candidatus Woesearchaeota archaeon]
MNDTQVIFSNKRKYKGVNYRFSLLDTDDYTQFSPITQAYGFCYTEDGKLIIGKKPNGDICMPGGTVERDEDPLDTLTRELDEEITAVVLDKKFIGIQKAENMDTGEIVYQLRFACLVRLEEMTPDPDYGECWQRVFIEPNDFSNYLQWGEIGEHLVKKSKKWFDKNHE